MRAAEYIIGKLDNNPEIIEPLIKALEDADRGVRDVCSRALVYAPQSIKSEIAAALAPKLSDRNYELRNLAADILTKLGEHAAPTLIDFLLVATPEEAKFACDILGVIGDARAIGAINAYSFSPDPNLAGAAIEAVGNIAYVEKLDKEERDAIIVQLCERYSENPQHKPIILETIGKIGGEAASDFLVQIMRLEPDMFLRTTAVDALSFCGEDETTCKLIFAEMIRYPESVRPAFLKSIYAIAHRISLDMTLPEKYRDVARGALFEDDEDLRRAALLALGSIYSDNDVRALLAEVIRCDAETTSFIITNLMSRSPADTVSYFFRELADYYLSKSELGSDLDVISIVGLIKPSVDINNLRAAFSAIMKSKLISQSPIAVEVIDMLKKIDAELTEEALAALC